MRREETTRPNFQARRRAFVCQEGDSVGQRAAGYLGVGQEFHCTPDTGTPAEQPKTKEDEMSARSGEHARAASGFQHQCAWLTEELGLRDIYK